MADLNDLLRAIFGEMPKMRVAVGTKDNFTYFISLNPREDGTLAVLVADTSVTTEHGWKGYSTVCCCREHARECALEVMGLLRDNPELRDTNEFMIQRGKENTQPITDPDMLEHIRSGGRLN